MTRFMHLIPLSGPYDRRQRHHSQDGNDALEIVSQHVEAHLRADALDGPGQKVGRTHPGLQRSERVFDGLPADAHDVRCLIQPLLHGIEDRFMLPALDAP